MIWFHPLTVERWIEKITDTENSEVSSSTRSHSYIKIPSTSSVNNFPSQRLSCRRACCFLKRKICIIIQLVLKNISQLNSFFTVEASSCTIQSLKSRGLTHLRMGNPVHALVLIVSLCVQLNIGFLFNFGSLQESFYTTNIHAQEESLIEQRWGEPWEETSEEPGDINTAFLIQPLYSQVSHDTLKQTFNHMIEEPSRMRRQLGKDREGGMEREKLSSRLAQNTAYTARVKRSVRLSVGGLDSPNHVAFSLLLGPKRRRREEEESHIYLHMSTSVLHLWFKKKKKRNSQFLNTSPIYSCTPAQIDDNSLSFLFLYVFFFALSYNYSATYTHQPKDKTLRSANQPSNYPHSPPPLLLRFPPPNPPPIQPLSVPIGNKVNTYASQQPLKTTDACRDAPAVYVSLSPPPPPPPLSV